MFLEYGFSAKKTAGWGVVRDTELDGVLRARGLMWPPLEKRGKEGGRPAFQRPDDNYLGLMDEAGMPTTVLRKSDGKWLSNNEFTALVEKPCGLRVYRRFHNWYDAHGAAWQRQCATAETVSPQSPPIQTYTIKSVTALLELASSLPAAMQRGRADG